MRHTRLMKAGYAVAVASLLLAAPRAGFAQSSPYRGLWVGSASLNAVNEVAVPLDESNVPIAPKPEVPTPTFDRADIRLLIHVNGAGQAFLLKDVAVLNRAYGEVTNGISGLAKESDLSLVTDARLYPSFTPQPATRLASAVFDFGDARATDALDVIVDEAARRAASFATNASLAVGTQGERVQARQQAVAQIQPVLEDMAAKADVAGSFSQFLTDEFDTAAMTAIIADTSDPVVAALSNSAVALRDQSFYGDSRALDMVRTVVAAVDAAPPDGRARAAHFAASAFADVGNLYQRFISGSTMGYMIEAAAEEAAVASQAADATAATIETALRALPESVTALTDALQARAQQYDDSRATEAVNAVLAAMAQSAYDHRAESSVAISQQSEQAGRSVLADMVARYPLPVLTPTADYNEFVRSDTFEAVAASVAEAAAGAAIFLRATDPLYTWASLYGAAKVDAVNAIDAAYGAAARVMRTELPLEGVFAPGSGDPRAIGSLQQPSDLGPPGLAGRVYLPANYPTNPFRHRRHPDHTTGYNIERIVRLDFDGVDGDPLEPAGYGVDRITGTYREEIFGLHKPLGPEPETRPIGLRTEGRFELNRISLIDTLNTH